MKPWGGAALALALLAGCASDAPAPPPPAAPPSPASTPPAPAGPPPIALPPAPISVPPTAADQCGAYLLQHLIGRPRTEIPIPVDPTGRRVICSTCPRTFEFAPGRQTIEYDVQTGRITKVECS